MGQKNFQITVLGEPVAASWLWDSVDSGVRFGPVVLPPTFTALPSISFSGPLALGTVLTINPGTVSGGTVTALQLLRDGEPISGATGTSYTVTTADLGKLLAPSATASGPGGVMSATGAAVGPVADLEGSVTSNSITFNFGVAQAVGQYWNGEPYVVAAGPVSVVSTDPPCVTDSPTTIGGTTIPSLVRHGLMVNPARGTTGQMTPQGFTNAASGMIPGAATTLQPWDSALNKDPAFTGVPLVVSPGSCLMKLRNAASGAIPNNLRDGFTTDMAYLPVVTSAPAPNSFRPHPSAPDLSSYFTTADVDISWLPNVAAPSGMPTYETLLGRIDRSYQLVYNQRSFNRGLNPINHQNFYGGFIAEEVTTILVALCTNAYTTEQKRTMMLWLVQMGLDVLNVVKAGGLFAPSAGRGGTANYVKAVALLARRALQGASAASILAAYDALLPYTTNVWAPEDQMFRTVDRVQIETPISARTGYDRVPWEDYMENAPLWALDKNNISQNGSAWRQDYRDIVGGPILRNLFALRMMGIAGNNDPAALDYADFFWDWSKIETTWSGIYKPPAWMETLLDTHLPTVSSNYSDVAAPSIVRTVARGQYVWFEFNKLLSRRFIPAASAFTVLVNGSPRAVVTAADTFTIAPLTSSHRSPNIYGKSLAVRLATPVAQGDTVTIAYTQPGTNNARTLGGTLVPSISATTATNLTGVLPDPVTTIDRVNGQTNLARSLRQVSQTRAFPNDTVNWMQISARFRLRSLTTNDTIFGNNASTGLVLFWAAATTLRLNLVTNSSNDRINLAGAPSSLPALGTDITMHVWIDWNASTIADMYRITFRWNGGSWTPASAGAARATITSPTLQTCFANGLFIGGASTANREADMDHTAYLFRWGTGTAPTAPNFADPQFAWDADWGGNGQNVWGQPQLYLAGSLAEWNSAVPNRGSFGAYPLFPIKGAGDEEEGPVIDARYVLGAA